MACESTSQQAFLNLCDHTRETALLASVEELLGWDEQTKLPPAGGDYRAEQVACLAGLVHRRNTDPKVGEYLAELVDSPLAEDPHGDCGAVIRHLKRDYEKQIKLPQELVEELARTASLGQHSWAAARKENDFAKFQPLLEKMVDLKRQQAEAVGYDESPYDALMDDYEPGAKASEVTHVLGALRDELVPLIEQIIASGQESDTSMLKPNVLERGVLKRDVLKRDFPIAAQEAFGKQAATAIGFDFDAGRLDVTDHPFCCSPGPRDIRLTTRYDENSFESGLFSILHEAGHGIYEQGLPAEQFGLPTGEAVSLGIHESQSRLWENLVGRSRPFWEHFFPQAQAAFPTALGDVGFDSFYAAVNDVRPSLIRVEADEATYNLHILIRFELEQALIAGDLAVADLPGAWNEKYQSYLGIQSPTDSDGVLQDVHWSAGLFGYFPTYALGNLYASQFFEQANRELGDLDQQLGEGNFKPLREWLHQNIYQHGRRYSAGELAERITGHPLSHKHLMRHLEAKFEQLYELV